MKSWILYILTLASLMVSVVGCDTQKLEIINLRTDYLKIPMGIDNSNPRFTWEYGSKTDDREISSYEISIGEYGDSLIPYCEGMEFKPNTRYHWKVNVWHGNGTKKVESEMASFETGMMDSRNWKGVWITDTHDKDYGPVPMFRKIFRIGKRVKSARLYIASGGYHELYLNGNRIGDHYLDPEYTHFNKRCLYITHDITSLLNDGKNVLAAVLGNGEAVI